MKMDSPYWDWQLGVCAKHSLPSVPCPACMADGGDEDVEFGVEDVDLDFLDGQNLLESMDALREGRVDKDGKPVYRRATVRDLVPANFTNPKLR